MQSGISTIGTLQHNARVHHAASHLFRCEDLRLNGYVEPMPNAASSQLVLAKFSEQLVTETAQSALREVGGRASCAFVFCSPDYQAHLDDFLEILQVHGHLPLLVGCSGAGLIGTGAEAEDASGFSLLMLWLPHTKISPLSFPEAAAPAWDDAAAWQRAAGRQREERCTALLERIRGR